MKFSADDKTKARDCVPVLSNSLNNTPAVASLRQLGKFSCPWNTGILLCKTENVAVSRPFGAAI